MGTCVDMATNCECYTVVMVINFSHLPLLVSFRLHQPFFCWIVIALKNKSVSFFFRWTYIIIFFLISRRRGFCNLYPLVLIHCVNVRCMSKWSFIKRKHRHTCNCGIFWTSLYVWIIVSIVYGKKKCTFLGYEDIRVISGHVSYITDSCDLSECKRFQTVVEHGVVDLWLKCQPRSEC